MFNFLEYNRLGWRDAVDVFVVAIVLYYILLAIRGTRAVQILLGIVILLGVQALSFYLKLQSTYFVLRALVLSIVVALPIVFQPELRRALMQLGGTMKTTFHHIRHDVLVRIVDEISYSANLLSQTHTGALIVIERETGLEEYVENGVKINAEVSGRLLMSLFQKTSPLHDGAVILRADKVVAASCYLPLSDVRMHADNRHTGTRHRAALGLSEQTDCIIVVVSEETGDISIARGGHFSLCDSEDSLKRRLLEYLSPAAPAGASHSGLSLRAWMPWRLLRAQQAGDKTALPSVLPETRPERIDPATVARELPSEATPLDDEAIAEKQRQIERAVEKRASEARRREERRKDDELRKPEGEETDGFTPAAPAGPRPPRATPTAPRTEDTLQGRQ